MPIPFAWDWKNPDYKLAFEWRAERLKYLRANPASLNAIKTYYRDNPAQFIIDWGCTINPKNIERGLPAIVPFLLYPKQEDAVNWIVDHWRRGKAGLMDKTRQMGFSWLLMGTSCTLCLFYEGMSIGVGSRKEEYLDVIGDPKSLIQKGRGFMSLLPVELRGGWQLSNCAPHKRIIFPATKAIITGEAGDNIGRGNTTAIYFVDESGFLEHPQLIEQSLSQTTNCRIDISTPNGLANPFGQKRFSGKIDVFSFHWRDDPTKDEVWYARQCEELDEVTIAQELDLNYSASVEGVLIPSAWVQAAVDSHIKLGIKPTGIKKAAADIADQGMDKNAIAGRYGILLEHIEQFSGKGDDIFGTTERIFQVCDEYNYPEFDYDADGLGAGVRGDARIINERRKGVRPQPLKQIGCNMFRGSGAVSQPTMRVQISPGRYLDRTNEDFFANYKAQSWWALRFRFQNTFRAVQGKEHAPDFLISLDSTMKDCRRLAMELSQPTYKTNGVGKILVDKTPDGAKSPNLADAVMILFAPGQKLGPMKLHPGLVGAAGARMPPGIGIRR